MVYQRNKSLNQLIQQISSTPYEFGSYSSVYQQWAQELPSIIQHMYQQDQQGRFELALFGDIQLPYVSFGAINSSHLFGLDEIILFVFYWHNRHRYQQVYDLGANVGLHSILLSRCGYTVESYEPDPKHIAILNSNLQLNHCDSVTVHPSAVYTDHQAKEFVRVVDNTTGSHIAGMKKNPYGKLDTFTVSCTPFTDILLKQPSLIKMDIEGAEADVICTTEQAQWQHTDMLLEVGTPENALRIWTYLSSINVNMFAQKCEWQAVRSVQDIPTSYKEGSLFISSKKAMPW